MTYEGQGCGLAGKPEGDRCHYIAEPREAAGGEKPEQPGAQAGDQRRGRGAPAEGNGLENQHREQADQERAEGNRTVEKNAEKREQYACRQHKGEKGMEKRIPDSVRHNPRLLPHRRRARNLRYQVC